MERSLLILLTVFSLLVGGQPKAGPPAITSRRPEKRYQVGDVIGALTAVGLTASDTGQTLEGEAFGAPGTVITVEGEAMQVYVYKTQAEQEAVKISPNGSSVEYNGTISMVQWLAPPHFARHGNLLITFATSNETLATQVIKAIEHLE